MCLHEYASKIAKPIGGHLMGSMVNAYKTVVISLLIKKLHSKSNEFDIWC